MIELTDNMSRAKTSYIYTGDDKHNAWNNFQHKTNSYSIEIVVKQLRQALKYIKRNRF